MFLYPAYFFNSSSLRINHSHPLVINRRDCLRHVKGYNCELISSVVHVAMTLTTNKRILLVDCIMLFGRYCLGHIFQ